MDTTAYQKTLATLLEIGMPTASWLGLAMTLILGLLCFLTRDAYQELKRKIQALQEEIHEIREDVEKERSRSDKEMRLIDGRINDLHINILNKLDEIKYKFNEFRK
jgi:hypothetical protein